MLLQPDRAWLHERAYSKVSLALAANCLLSLLLALGWGGRRIIQSSQKIWWVALPVLKFT